MKKYLSLLLATVLILSMAVGCGDQAADNTQGDQSQQPEEQQGRTFVYINVARVAVVSAVIAAGILLLMALLKWYRRYRKVHPNWRRQYRKERHRSAFSKWGNKKIK